MTVLMYGLAQPHCSPGQVAPAQRFGSGAAVADAASCASAACTLAVMAAPPELTSSTPSVPMDAARFTPSATSM